MSNDFKKQCTESFVSNAPSKYVSSFVCSQKYCHKQHCKYFHRSKRHCWHCRCPRRDFDSFAEHIQREKLTKSKIIIRTTSLCSYHWTKAHKIILLSKNKEQEKISLSPCRRHQTSHGGWLSLWMGMVVMLTGMRIIARSRFRFLSVWTITCLKKYATIRLIAALNLCEVK